MYGLLGGPGLQGNPFLECRSPDGLEAVLDTIYAAAREREIFLELHPEDGPPRRALVKSVAPTKRISLKKLLESLAGDHPTPELRSDLPLKGRVVETPAPRHPPPP